VLIGVILSRCGHAQLVFYQLAQQDNQTLPLLHRQRAPVDHSPAGHAGAPAISQVPATRYN
jgi:hypothetical protein